MFRTRPLAFVSLVALLAAAPLDTVHGAATPGAVYTVTNALAGSEILVFDRGADGALTPAGKIVTGGAGTGGGLGNQGGLTLTNDGRWLLAVNAASDDVSVFAVGANDLTFADLESSGGVQPISVTVHDDLVFVLNAGSDSIAGFRLSAHGKLSPIPGSTHGP